MKIETKSDYLADNSIECPCCHVFIDENKLMSIEPDIGFQEMCCPHCSQKIVVSLEVITQYTARSKN